MVSSNRMSVSWLAAIGLGLLALSSLNSKIAGVLWGLSFIVAGVAAHRTRPWLNPNPIDQAAQTWLWSAAGALGCWVAAAAIWGELFPLRSGEINSAARLLTGALAAYWIVRSTQRASWTISPGVISIAVAIACVLAAFVSALTTDRERYPSNAIAWSSAVALLACLLAAQVIDRKTLARTRVVCALGIASALAAIAFSQTRGVYPVALWIAGVALIAGYRQSVHRIRVLAAAGASAIALALALSFAALHPGDPLRLREAISDLQQATSTQQFNSSGGARVYLAELGWRTVLDSPWFGIGANQRRELIQSSGLSESKERAQALEHVRQLAHVHNAYLHHTMDGGLIGLVGFLLPLLGLTVIAVRIRSVDPIASVQLSGIIFVHATTNLTSVNLAHNYYALMLAISVALVLIQAKLRALSPP